ncbi:hypothetical protein ABPG75_004725 [Micractinium tetrahymenae]
MSAAASVAGDRHKYRPNGCATEPKDFPAHLATHALFAFVFLNPDLSPKPLDYRDTELFAQMRRLKVANPALRIMVSIGGAYHDPGWDPTTYYHTTFDFYTKVAKVPPRKLNLGLAFYGVSWRLASPQRNGLHAPSAGPGTNGACTRCAVGPLLAGRWGAVLSCPCP